MKVVILAGGAGTRLAEETSSRPKPMVEIGGQPILWHIMNIYESYGHKEFVIALGCKAEIVKDYFLNYYNLQSDLTIKLKTGEVTASKAAAKDWVVDLVDTGLNTMTGGRLKRLRNILKGERFMMTYGDGLGNVDLKKLMAFHKSHGKIATVTAVRPAGRFGGMVFDGDRVKKFKEKAQLGEGWINGGFFVFEQGIFDYLEGDDTILEQDPLEDLARDGELMAYKHEGFWQCMDTLRDKQFLEELWSSGKAPWKK
ncbi:MAG: glucose-1-phosphate cytidylyltransferase [Candidatus Omnitrophota bacterium]